MADRVITGVNLDDLAQTLIYVSGVLLGASQRDDDVFARQGRNLAATAISLERGHKIFLQWRYDRGK